MTTKWISYVLNIDGNTIYQVIAFIITKKNNFEF